MPRKIKVVVLGGGSGAPGLIPGFSPDKYTRQIIIPMSDSGGGAVIVAEFFNLPAFSDLDRAIFSLAGPNVKPEMRILMSHRLEEPVGDMLLKVRASNLITSIFANHFGDIQNASDAVCRLLDVPVGDRVLPSTLVRANLVARLKDGSMVYGENNIDDPFITIDGKKVLDRKRMSNPVVNLILNPENVEPNPEAVSSILAADAVLIAPGSLYTSIIAGLIVPGISEAIASKSVPVILVANLMTEPYQTDHLNTVSSQIEEVLKYLPKISHVVINNRPIPQHLVQKYTKEGQSVVRDDLAGASNFQGAKLLYADLLGSETTQNTLGKTSRLTVLRHNPHSVEFLVSKIIKAN